MERRIGDRQLVNIVVFFLIVQFGGLLLSVAAFPIPQLSTAQAASGGQYEFTVGNIFIIILEIIVVSLVILYLMKKYKGKLLFLMLDGFIIIPGSAIFALLVIGILFPNFNAIYELILAVVLAIGLTALKQKFTTLRNLTVLISTMGIGVLFGFYAGFEFAYFFLVLLALYDYIAVFVTKHMISLANMAMQQNLSLFVGSSDVHMVPGKYVSETDRKAIIKSGIEKKIKDPNVKKMIDNGNVPFVSQINLGGGDLVAPLFLAIGAYVTFANFFIPIAIIFGSVVGVIATLLILKKYQVALPAIPPIFAFENLFLGIIFLTYEPEPLELSGSLILVFVAIMFVMFYTLTVNKMQQKKN